MLQCNLNLSREHIPFIDIPSDYTNFPPVSVEVMWDICWGMRARVDQTKEAHRATNWSRNRYAKGRTYGVLSSSKELGQRLP